LLSDPQKLAQYLGLFPQRRAAAFEHHPAFDQHDATVADGADRRLYADQRLAKWNNDREWIANLVRITELELPPPKPKKPKRAAKGE
jgi:hypothetical protein